MRLVALVASAFLLVASSANAHVFDPKGSFVHIRIGGLGGNESSYIAGFAEAAANGKLTGAFGSEVLEQKGMGMGLGELFAVDGRGSGEPFFTGTPVIQNLFFTFQSQSATFVHGAGKGTFQGAAVCAASCFGGANGIVGQVLVEVTGNVTVPVPVGVIGAGGKNTVSLGAASIAIEGAQWVTGDVPITNIATNVFQITNGARVGVSGVGFTLQGTVNENSDLVEENGVTQVSVHGTTSFETDANTVNPGVNQVTLVSPVHINAGTVTGNPPLPGMAMEIMRYVPEPGTLLLLGSAVAGLLVVGRKRMKR